VELIVPVTVPVAVKAFVAVPLAVAVTWLVAFALAPPIE
jgi:hypothetical protein